MNVTEQDIRDATFTHGIDVYYPPILIVLGVACNILVLLVMRTRYFRYQPSSVYMIAGSINDIFSLSISMTTHWLHVTFDVYSRDKTRYICKFLDFYGWGNCDLGILITTAMTIDRALAIKFPLKKNDISTFRRAKIAIFVVTVITFAKEFHFFIGSDMVEEDRSERLCDVYPKSDAYEYFWTKIWPWFHLSFLVICFILMFISNIVLLCSIWKSSHREILNSVEKLKFDRSFVRGNKQVQTITPMLIGESIVLLLLTFPFSTQLFISGYDSTYYQTATTHFVFSLTFYMLYTNKCVNFFVYLVTGHRFRLGLKELITMCCYGKKKFRQSLYQSTLGHMAFSKPRIHSSGEHNTVFEQDALSSRSASETNNNSKSDQEKTGLTILSKQSEMNLQLISSIISRDSAKKSCPCKANATLDLSGDSIRVVLSNNRGVTECSYL
ncbi:thyrotropin-releasing hormone receptor-like [Mytilus californianus]|uniref:thyrotropin-releasing hormone receptor-like n=1 Tax=Mytilus californianus TaxID=6549 RepID=UPI00224608F7|nr:thyrotropin-releasing hormone receptor-like [Mytilus californianus]